MTKNILVIDDDANICELLRMYLEKEGYEVRTASDGSEAKDRDVEMLHDSPPSQSDSAQPIAAAYFECCGTINAMWCSVETSSRDFPAACHSDTVPTSTTVRVRLSLTDSAAITPMLSKTRLQIPAAMSCLS